MVDGLAEAVQAAGDVPAAEGLLDVRHGGQRGGGPARVGAGVGGVAVEQDAQPGVAQVPPTELAQGAAGSDDGEVLGVPDCQPGEGAGAVER